MPPVEPRLRRSPATPAAICPFLMLREAPVATSNHRKAGMTDMCAASRTLPRRQRQASSPSSAQALASASWNRWPLGPVVLPAFPRFFAQGLHDGGERGGALGGQATAADDVYRRRTWQLTCRPQAGSCRSRRASLRGSLRVQSAMASAQDLEKPPFATASCRAGRWLNWRIWRTAAWASRLVIRPPSRPVAAPRARCRTPLVFRVISNSDPGWRVQ